MVAEKVGGKKRSRQPNDTQNEIGSDSIIGDGGRGSHSDTQEAVYKGGYITIFSLVQGMEYNGGRESGGKISETTQ
jgi:hypothetical protein